MRTPQRRRVRACAVEMHMDISQEQFYGRISREKARAQDQDAGVVRACAIQMHMDRRLTRAVLCENLQEYAGPLKINRAWTSHKLNCMREVSRKKTGPKVETTPRPTLCASCAVKMHMDMDICEEAVYAKVFKENAPDQDRDNRFRRACAVKMHMDMDICEEAV